MPWEYLTLAIGLIMKVALFTYLSGERVTRDKLAILLVFSIMTIVMYVYGLFFLKMFEDLLKMTPVVFSMVIALTDFGAEWMHRKSSVKKTEVHTAIHFTEELVARSGNFVFFTFVVFFFLTVYWFSGLAFDKYF